MPRGKKPYWIDTSTHNGPETQTYVVNGSIEGRVTRRDGGYEGGRFNKAGQYTPLIPKPYASLGAAMDAVEESAENAKEVRG